MEKIRHLSITDNLTGCYNRLHITENLDRKVSRSWRYKRSLSLAMFDIDQFKIVEEMRIEWENSVILITASFGLTGFNPTESATAVNAEQLVNAADEALYKAKQTGRNKVAANFIKIEN